jgi:hypothetical protein
MVEKNEKDPFWRDVHPEKHLNPILAKEFGIVMEKRDVNPEKQ